MPLTTYFSYQPDVPHQESPWLSVGVTRETGLSEADATLIRLAPDMAAMLRELEWSSTSHWEDERCPVCGKDKSPEGNPIHFPDCRLDALLKELP